MFKDTFKPEESPSRVKRCYGREDGLEVTSAERLFARDSAGAFWMGDGTEITRWRPGESKTVFRPESLHSNEGNLGISALVPETDGSLWVGMAISGRLPGEQSEVVGINFAMVRDFGGSNFAIPIGYGRSLLKP